MGKSRNLIKYLRLIWAVALLGGWFCWLGILNLLDRKTGPVNVNHLVGQEVGTGLD